MEIYDTIGQGYQGLRCADPRILAAILRALGESKSVVNVGAGAGSYEPRDRLLFAVEPSMTMIRQRRAGAASVVRAPAERLPFGDGAADATLAILTLHHWSDLAGGLRELRRVASQKVVLLSWDPEHSGFWLTDYFPEILEIDRQIFPSLDDLREHLGPLSVTTLPIPWDCSDGFLGAYWRRPQSYLDSRTRSAISTFSKIAHLDHGLDRLSDDLSSGRWGEQNADILGRDALDLGYRIIVADLSPVASRLP